MGACPYDGEYHDDDDQLECYGRRIDKYQKLESAHKQAGLK